MFAASKICFRLATKLLSPVLQHELIQGENFLENTAEEGISNANMFETFGTIEEVSNSTVAEKNENFKQELMRDVDCIIDDLLHCDLTVLRRFMFSHKIKNTSTRRMLVTNIINKCFEEARSDLKDDDSKKMTVKLMGNNQSSLGKEENKQKKIKGRNKWTDETLETSFLENACLRYFKYQKIVSQDITLAIRQNGRRAEGIMKALLRIFFSDFKKICDEAVKGVHRSYHEDADEIVKSNSAIEILSPFCSVLTTHISIAGNSSYFSYRDAKKLLSESGGLYSSTPLKNEQSFSLLTEHMMGMLDQVSRDAETCTNIWINSRSKGMQTPKSLIEVIKNFEDRKRYWDFENVPTWISDLAVNFSTWETIIRNDIKILENAPSYIFSSILFTVTIFRCSCIVYGEEAKNFNLSHELKNILKEALSQHFYDAQKVSEIITKLSNSLKCAVKLPQIIPTEFYKCLNEKLENIVVQNSNTLEKRQREAMIFFAASYFTSMTTNNSNLYWLLLQLTCDMQFHLRFSRVYKKLNYRDRLLLQNYNSKNYGSSLLFFERELGMAPLDSKSVCFLCISLLTLTLKTGRLGQANKLNYYPSVSGIPDFGLLDLADRPGPLTGKHLALALPPQLSYKPWTERDDNDNSVYQSINGTAVKGSMSNVMLLSQAPIIKALDCISKVPWRISRYMLYVQEAILREGYGFGKIRSSFYPLNYTNKKTGEILHEGQDRSIFNVQLSGQYRKQRDIDWRRTSELRSSRVHYLQAMRQARALVQYSHIYFPHSLDFRGRMYPLPGRLNHTGSDPFRALMEYAEPKPLGRTGLYWLKVHLANKMGITKATFAERVQFVDEHITDVINSAESPLQGDRWWQSGAEPLQALMACHELSEALKCSQGVENYMSHIPLAVDGSYNGLQHYSAIGRDEYGARLVNLSPSERPVDAYTGILKEMLLSIERDAAQNMQVAQRCLGTGVGLDKNHIKLKTIKRPIMTQVYGVTNFGMQEQIFQELYKQNFQHGLWTRVDVKEMAYYLRDKLLDSLGVTFRQTQECRKWIEQVVTLIWRCQPRELRDTLSWTTPLGLIVRQPYRAHAQGNLFTLGGRVKISAQTLSPASRKQLSAIAPNLIHSLDATHLAMTAIEMNNRGLEMMAVHDSFWTHACDLPTLSTVLREQFVELYKNYDPLTEIKEQWEEQFFFDLRRHNLKLPDPPERGKLDLAEVLKSPYFFA